MGDLRGSRGPSLLLFGPQTTSFNNKSISELKSALICQKWAIDTLSELPSIWETASTRIPTIPSVPGKRLLENLHTWLTDGPPEYDVGDLPNTLLAPLTVLSQLAQYRRYLEIHYGDAPDAHAALVRSKNTTVLGFCEGLLTAFAIASSESTEDWNHHAAVAVRLAMLVGAVVDGTDETHSYGASESFATACHTREQDIELGRILSLFHDDAYVSVWYDERRATVTVSRNEAPVLLQELREAGIVAATMGLRGRFHSEQNRRFSDALIQLCDVEPGLTFTDSENLVLPTYTNAGDGSPVSGEDLHKVSLREILVQQCNWHKTISGVVDTLSNEGERLVVTSIGPGRFVPPSLSRRSGLRIEEISATSVVDSPEDDISPYGKGCFRSHTSNHPYNNKPTIDEDPNRRNDIAIVGMSIKVAGADDVAEFSSVLRSGKSQHQEVPAERVPFGNLPWRRPEDSNGRKWYGNFMRDVDAFDHKFFRKSPRESAAMDPQQRLILQAAYQAVEQSGYFSTATPSDRDKHIGVYLGTCATDYDQNAACHAAGAFTVTGLLRGFIAGKVSHYFGWTGPSMTLDTACSGAAVAIHSAVKALQSGECSAALCGGVNVLGNAVWFQNLAGASFLSPTGQCKPFDEGADGYCRGEGIACVFLKPMAAALAGGDRIFGRIASTAVYQNDNATPIFVPNAPSLSRLFTDVVRQAKLEPRDISLVEAHGTGTAVGDPAEYQSVRTALAGTKRSKPLPLGSVKGFIGHTESASGIVSLIKVITMMHEDFIPPQASHVKMSHRLDASPSDMIVLPTSLQIWNEEHKAALINNYGASGSNAAMVVMQAPRRSGEVSAQIPDGVALPFYISGFDSRSITAYCAKLVAFIQNRPETISLADLSFNVNRQSNHTLSRALLFRCSTVAGLLEQLSATTALQPIEVKSARPIILCFGGQYSTYVGLDRKVYDNVPLLRYHLDRSSAIAQSLGIEGIYPGIFSKIPIADQVHLQTMLFALQYASAKCWMDCGVKVEAVVGHSFGEITALCVAGVLGLRDAIKLVAGRAKVVRDLWGPDRGAMMAVDGDLQLVEWLLEESNLARQGGSPASIACYNGPQSFTLAGSVPAMDSVAEILSSNVKYSSIKSKRLNVTNAFHSALVDPLAPSLQEVGVDLAFHDPVIRLERATETSSANIAFTPQFISDHMHKPVFFHQAVQRLAKDYPSAIWLEAGSASKITSMAKRVVGTGSNSHFQGVSLTEDKGIDGLTDATLSLWKEGLHVTFWPHHGPQAARDHAPLLLPPYQFEKSRHWLELKAVPTPGPQQEESLPEDPSLGLWSFVGYQDTEKRHARFKINTDCERYTSFVSPHIAVQTAPICSATLEYTMATEALFSLCDDFPSMKDKTLYPIIRDMHNDAPLCINPTRSAWLELRADDNHSRRSWAWSIVTTAAGQQPDSSSIMCVQGKLELRSSDEVSEFSRHERLVTHAGCISVLQDEAGADNGLQGRSIYRALADVVDYGEVYRGASRVVGRGSECAGIVLNPTTHASSAEGTWLDDIPVVDSYSQVAGVWVNCMADRQSGDNDVFLATGCELIMRSPTFLREDRRRQPGKAWHVLAKHHRESEKAFLTDLFVFDAADGRLTEVMLGIRYFRIAKLSMRRVLERLSDASVVQTRTHNGNKNSDVSAMESHAVHRPQLPLIQPLATSHQQNLVVKKTTKPAHSDLSQKVRNVVAIVSGVEEIDIKDDSELADLGVDSLAGMELAREIETVLHFKPNMEELLFEATTFRELVACISKAMGGPDDLVDAEQTYEDGNEPSSPAHGSTLSERSGDTQIIITPTSQDVSFTDGQGGDATIEAVIAKTSALAASGEQLSQRDILNAFAQVKATTDQRIRDKKVDITDSIIMARSNRLCVALIVEAFEQVGCSFRTAIVGQDLQRISHPPQHSRLVDWLYSFLEKEARLIDINGSRIKRTAIPAPRKTSDVIYQELIQANDTWIVAHRLAYYAGKNLADVISGKKDGIQALFGSSEGRDLVRGLYCDLPFNRLFYEQMRDTVRILVEKLPSNFQGPLRILEMGAGTGGTTYILAPFLATLNVPVEYTITDLSPSMVAQARRTFGAQYPFMRFAVHDIEQLPDKSLLGTQHIVVASNAIHATVDLAASASNIHAALRPDGILLMTEMTEGLAFVDIVFGLLEGWWRFADDRVHALVSAEHWSERLREAGFGHVDWTDGSLSENKIQKVIIALSSGLTGEIPVAPTAPLPTTIIHENTNIAAREEEAKRYVAQYSAGFMTSVPTPNGAGRENNVQEFGHDNGAVVIVTGGTGSLGSHLVARFAEDPSVSSVICLNRRSSGNTSALQRQQEALSSRGINLSPNASSKLRVFATDTAQPHLGLSPADYERLVSRTTHIVHNAWPMTANRPMRSFDTQFQVFRHLVDLAAEISAHHTGNNRKRVCFQFISSIGVAGQGLGSRSRVPEERLPFSAVPPVGYCEAKWACERILDETLHRHPDRFRTMAVRPGQIAGSSATGLWNPTEHFAFLVRSAQSLRAFPVLEGRLQWVPVDSVAGTCADLALNEEAGGPVYHIDNPVGQPWEEMVDVLIGELDIPRSSIVPFLEWIRKVRRSPLAMETENPALRMVDFLEKHFVRISCVGVILDTAKAKEQSPTLAAQGPIPTEVVRRYVREWKAMGFLDSC